MDNKERFIEINNYPRKILGYKSSEIVFRECLRELGIAA